MRGCEGELGRERLRGLLHGPGVVNLHAVRADLRLQREDHAPGQVDLPAVLLGQREDVIVARDEVRPLLPRAISTTEE